MRESGMEMEAGLETLLKLQGHHLQISVTNESNSAVKRVTELLEVSSW